jgi:hypothetical protein
MTGFLVTHINEESIAADVFNHCHLFNRRPNRKSSGKKPSDKIELNGLVCR